LEMSLVSSLKLQDVKNLGAFLTYKYFFVTGDYFYAIAES